MRVFPELNGAKFLTPKNAEPFPLIPPETREGKDKTHKPVIITEGPVKALALLQAGALPIGLGRVWMATRKAENGPVELTPDGGSSVCNVLCDPHDRATRLAL